MRDDLTVLVQRIHPRADDFEIFEFFSQAGKVRDIRLIRDHRSNKSKGVGYVEFLDAQSVLNALALNGIAFKGQPLLVQASMAEKNRLAQQAKNVAAASAMMGGSATGATAEPSKLVVSELHPNMTQQDVSEVFEPFGEISEITMPNNPDTGVSLGIANITFVKPEEAKAAQEALNGLELVGKRIIVSLIAEPPPTAAGVGMMPAIPSALPNLLPNLMGMPGMPGMPGMLPNTMPNMMMPNMMMGMGGVPGMPGAAAGGEAAPAGVRSCFVRMSNLFDPESEEAKDDPEFFDDLKEDVTDEMAKFGEVIKSTVLRESAGLMLFHFADEEGASKASGGMNGRWFNKKQISAVGISEEDYKAALGE